MSATKTQITGGAFQDNQGNVLNNGYLTFELNQDENITNVGNIVAGEITKVPLDSSGDVSGTVYMWANDVMLPDNSYYTVKGYTSEGQLAWGPNNQQITSGGTGGGTFDLGTWVPNVMTNWTPTVVVPELEVNGTLNTVQTLLNFTNSATVTWTDNGDGSVSASSSSGVTTTNHFIGARGVTNMEATGTPTNLQPVTGSVTTQFVAAVRFTLEAAININKVVMGSTNFNAGVHGGIGIYDANTKSLIFQVNFVSPGTVALFTTAVSPMQSLPAGDYFFAWTAASTLFQVRALAMDPVVNSFMNADASNPMVVYGANLGVNGVLPSNLGALTAIDLVTSTGVGSIPLALFLN